MKFTTTSTFAASLLAVALPVSAAWDVVTTFDDVSEEARLFTQFNAENTGASATVANGVLSLEPGDLFETTTNMWTRVDIGVDLQAASLAAGGPITVFIEVQQPLINGTKSVVDTTFGLNNVADDEILTERFNSFSAMARIDSGSDELQGRNGGGYEPGWVLDGGESYGLWFVVDYSPAVSSSQLYLQGGSNFATQMGLDNDTNGGNFWLFRVTPETTQTVDSFLFGLSRGNSVDGEKGTGPTYIDNIYVDVTGENLTDPRSASGPTWAGFDLDANGWTINGTPIGYVNASFAPWIYIIDIDSFAYAEGFDFANSGNWIYLQN